MDSGDLRAFLAFADPLNFTVAARAVHLSQPAVFAIVKRLGDDVGAALYEKTGRALSLTDAGRKLAAHARDVDAAERELRRGIAGDDEDLCVLACGEGALTHVIAAGVARFARAQPRKLRVTLADGPGAVDLVARRTAHVAVTAGPAASHADLVERVLVKSRVVAVATRALFASIDGHDGPGGPGGTGGAGGDGPPLSIAALAHAPLLLPPRGRPLRKSVDDAFAAAGKSARVDVEVSGWGALVVLARLGCGVALVNDVVTAPGLVSRRVDGLAPVTYRTVTHRKRTPLALELLRALHHVAPRE